jgi:alkylhydroperoxidase/carboxymuconolactone decarboxylase family protein YurZ
MHPEVPETYKDFVARFPALGEAWELLHRGAEDAGPLDSRTLRLVKLGIAIGAQREGAVHSATRRAINDGIPRKEIEQVVASAASTIGLPASVAAFTWVRDSLEKKGL